MLFERNFVFPGWRCGQKKASSFRTSSHKHNAFCMSSHSGYAVLMKRYLILHAAAQGLAKHTISVGYNSSYSLLIQSCPSVISTGYKILRALASILSECHFILNAAAPVFSKHVISIGYTSCCMPLFR